MTNLTSSIENAIRTASLHLIVLSQPRQKQPDKPSKVTVRPVTISDRLVYQAAKRVGP